MTTVGTPSSDSPPTESRSIERFQKGSSREPNPRAYPAALPAGGASWVTSTTEGEIAVSRIIEKGPSPFTSTSNTT